MIKDYSKNIYNIPNPSFGKGTIIKRLNEFIWNTLIIFQQEFKGHQESSEDILSEHFSKTFDFYAKHLPFIFIREAAQRQTKGQNRNVDIGVFQHYAEQSPFFVIEAKRLPTLPKRREKEYVIGDNILKPCGGIERFKLNIHAPNLSESAMIGYVQSGELKKWFHKINKWIEALIEETENSDLSWTMGDLLENKCDFKKENISYFTSKNKKNNNTTIKLYHYLVDMSE